MRVRKCLFASLVCMLVLGSWEACLKLAVSEVFQVESVQSCVRDMFLLLAPDSLWCCPFYRKGTRKNSTWEGEGINALCQLIGQWVTDSLNRGIDSRKEIDLWLLQVYDRIILQRLSSTLRSQHRPNLWLIAKSTMGTLTIMLLQLDTSGFPTVYWYLTT